jgi:small subunit ribosomal protein S3
VGQKVHPGGMRLGIIHDWKAHWYTERHFADFLHEDLAIRKHIQKKMGHAGLSTIVIRKDTNKVVIDIHTARPGIVIGKSGSEVDALRRDLHDMTGKTVHVNIVEIKRPELDATLVAQGIKVRSGGRLGGAEMARTEGYSEGRVPLHTLRADIDYGFWEANTTFGKIGVKVWINKGEIMPEGFDRSGRAQSEAPLG